MKKFASLLLLLLPMMVMGQNMNPTPGRNWTMDRPETKPSGFKNKSDILWDTTDYVPKISVSPTKWEEYGHFKKFVAKALEDNIIIQCPATCPPGQPGQNGKDATVTVGNVTTTTTSPGTPAQVTVTDTDPDPSTANLNFSFSIPQGEQGLPGTGGGSGGVFPWIVVVGTGNDDAAVQSALNENLNTGKPIVLVGRLSFGQKMIPREQFRLTVIAYGATITMKGTGTLWKRVAATSVADANVHVMARHTFSGGDYIGGAGQICFDLGAGEQCKYEDMEIKGFDTGIWAKFQMASRAINNKITSVKRGILVDILDCPGGAYTASNVQSNNFLCAGNTIGFQVPNAAGNVGIGVYGCSGFEWDNNIVQGGKYDRSLDFDFKKCPNAKEGHIKISHNETVYGTGNAGTGQAYFYIRMTGMMTIDGIYSQYKGCMIDAGSDGGLLTVLIKNVAWLVKDDNGKLFHNAGGVRWVFDVNHDQSGLDVKKIADTSPQGWHWDDGTEYFQTLFTGVSTTPHRGEQMFVTVGSNTYPVKDNKDNNLYLPGQVGKMPPNTFLIR